MKKITFQIHLLSNALCVPSILKTFVILQSFNFMLSKKIYHEFI